SASETTTPASCNGGNDGSVTVTVSGGSPPYSVTVNNVTHTGVTGSTIFTGLASGTYPAAITDAHSCSGSAAGVLVGQADALVASETHDPIGCFGGTTTVNITASGGIAPYSGDGAHTGISAGPFSFTVTDANGCSTVVSGTISQPPALGASESHDESRCVGGGTTVNINAAGVTEQ